MPATIYNDEEERGEKKKWTTMRSQPLNADQSRANREAYSKRREKEDLHKKQEAEAAMRIAELASKANEIDKAFAVLRDTQSLYNRQIREAKAKAQQDALKYFKQREDKRKSKLDQGRLLDNTDISMNKRAYMYGIHHKHTCGRKYSQFYRDAQGWQMRCDCDTMWETWHKAWDFPCRSCGTLMSFGKAYVSTCGCISVECCRCRRRTYEYSYGDNSSYQWYDRHIDRKGTVVVTVDNQDHCQTDFKQWFENNRAPPRRDRNAFFRSLQPTQPSYATIVAPRLERDHPLLPRPSLVTNLNNGLFKETTQEGGVLGAISSPFTAAGAEVKKALQKIRDVCIGKVREVSRAIKGYSMFKAFQKPAKLFLKAFKYIINSVYDVLWALNPLQLHRLWEARTSTKSFLLALAEAAVTFKTHLDLSVAHMGMLAYGTEDMFLQFLNGKQYIGVLDTYVRYHVKRAADPREELRRLALSIAEKTTSFPSLATFLANAKEGVWNLTGMTDENLKSDEPKKTRQESGMGELLKAALSFLPKAFSSVIGPLNSLFKEFHPLLSGMNALGNLTNLAVKFGNAVFRAIFGPTLNNREWIMDKLTTAGNPIHDLLVTFLMYDGDMGNISHCRFDASQARADFYDKLKLADQYAAKEMRNGVEWLQYTNYLCSRFNTPPTPRQKEYEPTALWLGGQAGVGKSTCWKVIVSEIMRDKYKDDMAKNNVKLADKIDNITHTYNAASSEFQTGMADKKIILYDDFGQNRENIDEVMSVISLCTTAPTPVNTPAITGKEIKGMFCEPDILVMCSNLTPEQAAERLFSLEAMKRRIDFGVELLVRYDHKNPEAKTMKITQCNRYKQLIGKEISLTEARTIFTVLHHKKRSDFKKVGVVQDEVMMTPLEKDALFGGHIDKTKIKDQVWQLDQDFVKDMDAYFAAVETKATQVPDKAPAGISEQNTRVENLMAYYTSKQPTPKAETPMESAPWYKKLKATAKGVFEKKPKEEFPSDPTLALLHAGSQALAEDSDDEWEGNVKFRPPDRSDELKIPNIKVSSQESGTAGGMLHALYSAILCGASMAVPVGMAIGIHGIMSEMYKGVFQHTNGRDGWHLIALVKRMFIGACKLIFATVVSALSAYAFYKFFCTDTEEESGGTRTAKASKAKITVPQGGVVDMEVLDVIFRKATGSIRRAEDRATVNVIFVGGHFILAPKHIFQTDEGVFIKDKTEMDLIKSNWNGKHRTIQFERKSMYELKTRHVIGSSRPVREDVVLYKLPATLFSAEKNIAHFFWDGGMYLTGHKVTKIDFLPWNVFGQYDGTFIMGEGKVTHDQIVTPRVEEGEDVYHIVAEADYPPRPASCGSIVRLSRMETPIVGIHIASDKDGSCFHFVTRQALEAVMKSAPIQDVEENFIHTDPEAAILELLPKESSLHFEGIVDKPVFMPSKTSLTPSLVYGCDGPAITAPAPLSHRDERIAEQFQSHKTFWQKMFSGYQVYPGRFVPGDLIQAFESIRDEVSRMPKTTGVQNKVLNLDQCLNGLPDLPENTRIDMTSSTGWPYVQQNLTKQDLIYVGVNGEYIATDRLRGDFLSAVDNIEQGKIPFLPFSLTLKDERVKLKKIVDPKTRIFACGNIIHYLVSRKYFYTRIMQFYHNKVQDSFCIPSLDRLSLQWDRLANHMLEVGWQGFDFDFTFFDRTIQHILLYYATNILTHGMGLGIRTEAVLAELMASPYMIFQKYVLRSNGVLMSGALLTYLINCIMNELMHRAAWVHIMSEAAPMLSEMRLYKQYTRGMRGGDDTITTVNSRALEFFNGQTVAAYLKTKGMLVTSATKSDEIPKSSNFEDLIFLKNRTQMMRGKYLPLPEFESLRESAYWIRLNKHNQWALKATQDNVICSLRGMYFHGKEVFDDFRVKALRACSQLELPTYRELSAIWRAYHHFPGAHADYATKELQEDPIEIAIRTPIIPESERLAWSRYDEDMPVIETKPEVGVQPMDKLDIERAGIETAPTAVDMKEVDAKNIENTGDADLKKSEQTRVGATIQDGGDLKITPVLVGAIPTQSRNPRAEAYANDTNWDLKKLEHKFTYIESIDWPLTAVVGTVLKNWAIPTDIIVTPAQKTPFDVTRLWRCEQIRMKMVIKSSPFYAGSLGMGFTPLGDTVNPRTLINLGAMIQKTSQNDGFEFIIPFRAKYGFLDIVEGNQILGTFSLFVVSQLATGPSNPNNISIAVYAAIEGSEFKLPEPIPAAEYTSHKFDKLRVKQTIKESGTLEDKRTVIVDVNTTVCDMQKTMMCAGKGLIGRVPVAHFQDQPNEITQLLKRWQLASRVKINAEADTTYYLDYDYPLMASAVCLGLDQLFAMWRGSINIRFLVHSSNPNSRALLYTTFNFDTAGIIRNQLNAGYSYGAVNQPIQVTIPWVSPYFVEYTIPTGFPVDFGVLSLGMEVFEAEELTVEMYISAGDDFSLGYFSGCPVQLWDTTKLALQFSSTATKFDATFPPKKEDSMEMLFPSDIMSRSMQKRIIPILKTQKQGGIVEFVKRAVETTLPLVDAVSDLGNLLDAHMVTEQPSPMQIRNIPYSVAADLPQYTERLKTLNHNGLSLPDRYCFGTAEKETDIHKMLTCTKSWTKNFSWPQSATVGTQLFTFFNGPDIPLDIAGQLHDQIPQGFRYWAGSTVYIFDIIATEMHRGQLLFTYNTAPSDISFTDATQTYFATYDLAQGRGTIALQLPFLAAYPFREVPKKGGTRNADNATGKLQCFVINPLRSTATVAPNVDIVVYKSYGGDFQLAMYGEESAFPPITTVE
jgi:PIN domain nuclease of toxin-antitoxin system